MTDTKPPQADTKEKSIPLTINRDAETEKLVENFLKTKQGSISEPSPDGEAPPPKVSIPVQDDFNQQPQTDALMTEALIDARKVEVTDKDRELFLKALLTESRFELVIPLFGGKMQVEIKSRTVHEQRRIFDIIAVNIKDGIIPNDNVVLYQDHFAHMCAALMIKRINGDLFSELTFDPGGRLEDDVVKVRKVINDKVITLQGIRWTAVKNAMSIFEAKCAELSREAMNEDFWAPRS